MLTFTGANQGWIHPTGWKEIDLSPGSEKTIKIDSSSNSVRCYKFGLHNSLIPYKKHTPSGWTQQTFGVPQGSITGIIIFIIFMNDVSLSKECQTKLVKTEMLHHPVYVLHHIVGVAGSNIFFISDYQSTTSND